MNQSKEGPSIRKVTEVSATGKTNQAKAKRRTTNRSLPVERTDGLTNNKEQRIEAHCVKKKGEEKKRGGDLPLEANGVIYCTPEEQQESNGRATVEASSSSLYSLRRA